MTPDLMGLAVEGRAIIMQHPVYYNRVTLPSPSPTYTITLEYHTNTCFETYKILY